MPYRVGVTAQGPRLLFQLLARSLLFGLVLGLAVAAAFYALDIGRLRTLTAATRDGGLAMFIFGFAMSFTFGAMAMGVAVMLQPRDPAYGADARAPVKAGDDRPER